MRLTAWQDIASSKPQPSSDTSEVPAPVLLLSPNSESTGNAPIVQASDTRATSTVISHPSQTGSLLPDTVSTSNSDGMNHTAGTSGRPIRSRHLPTRFRDLLPEPSLPSPTDLEAQSSEPTTSATNPTLHLPRIILHVFDSFRTSFNRFGVV